MTTFVLSLIKGGVNKGLNLFVGVIFVFIIVFQINQGVSKAMKKNRIHTAKMGDSVRKSYDSILSMEREQLFYSKALREIIDDIFVGFVD